MLRLIAGAFVAASVLLGILVHPYFLWFTLFVGLNLIQSAFTNWWPIMSFLRRLGVRKNASLDRMTHKAISLAEQRRCVAVGHCVDAQVSAAPHQNPHGYLRAVAPSREYRPA